MASGKSGKTIGILTGDEGKIENDSAKDEVQDDLSIPYAIGETSENVKRDESAQDEPKNGDDSGPDFSLTEGVNDSR